MEFKDWFWDKFAEWRGKTTNGPTAYARYLGIKQQAVNDWLLGKYVPKSQENISKLAEKYPEVYGVLGLEPPAPDLSAYPPEVRGAVSEIRQLLLSTDPAEWGEPSTAEAVRDILAKYGAVDTKIE